MHLTSLPVKGTSIRRGAFSRGGANSRIYITFKADYCLHRLEVSRRLEIVDRDDSCQR